MSKAQLYHFSNLGLYSAPSGLLRQNGVPVGNYMFKVNNRNTKTRCEICSKLTIKTPKRVFILNFEHISHVAVVFLLLTLNR